MHNLLTEVTADCTDVLVVKPQKVMPNPGRKNQIVHSFEDGRDAVVAVSNTSIFEVELQWAYVSETDRSTIFELFHDSTKANGSARSFYWHNPVDGYIYTVRFLTPLRTVYKPGILRSIETVKLRVDGIFGDHEYIIDLGDLHLATVNGGAMFFHDTEDFSAYAGASGNTPFRIVFTDDAGLTAEAWCGEVGGGLTTDGELITNGTFDTDLSGWNSLNWTWISSKASADVGFTNSLVQNILTIGQLYSTSFTVSGMTAGTCRLRMGSSYASTDRTEDGIYSEIGTCHGNTELLISRITAFDGDVDDVSCEKLTDIPSTGLKLYSTQNGTAQSMGTTDAGFDPTAIKQVDIYG